MDLAVKTTQKSNLVAKKFLVTRVIHIQTLRVNSMPTLALTTYLHLSQKVW